MNDDQLDDLKQYIDSRLSQSEHMIRGDMRALEVGIRGDMQKLEEGLRFDMRKLEDKMDDGFAGVGVAIDLIHQQMTERDIVVDKRLTKLEHLLLR